MNIAEVMTIAKHVAQTERMDFGAASTREQRNGMWARIIGIVHHGHPSYNPTPDNRWYLKSAGNGRPQSDDVCVDVGSNTMYDCIPSAGASGWYFNDNPHGEPFPSGQELIKPPVPSGSVPQPGGGGGNTGGGNTTGNNTNVNLQPLLDRIAALEAAVSARDNTIALIGQYVENSAALMSAAIAAINNPPAPIVPANIKLSGEVKLRGIKVGNVDLHTVA